MWLTRSSTPTPIETRIRACGGTDTVPGVISIAISMLGFLVSVSVLPPLYVCETTLNTLLSLMRKDRFREAKTLAPSHPEAG